MSAVLSSIFGGGVQLFDNSGALLSGGLIYTYNAGTTTPASTWTDSTQVTANANQLQVYSQNIGGDYAWDV